jgi:hypothetical protein
VSTWKSSSCGPETGLKGGFWPRVANVHNLQTNDGRDYYCPQMDKGWSHGSALNFTADVDDSGELQHWQYMVTVRAFFDVGATEVLYDRPRDD